MIKKPKRCCVHCFLSIKMIQKTYFSFLVKFTFVVDLLNLPNKLVEFRYHQIVLEGLANNYNVISNTPVRKENIIKSMDLGLN